MRRGLRFEKSFDGETTFAAMLVVSCAASTTSAAKMITMGPPIRLIRTTGSQTASPKMRIVALVTATPMKAKAVIVVGRPRACPSACDRCDRAYRVKSGMLRLSVAQYPTFAVSAAGKIARSEEHTSELQSRLHLVCRL